MQKMINFIVGGLVVLILAAVLLPIGINSIAGANTTGFSSGEKTLFGIVGTMVLIGVVVGVIYMATKHSK